MNDISKRYLLSFAFWLYIVKEVFSKRWIQIVYAFVFGMMTHSAYIDAFFACYKVVVIEQEQSEPETLTARAPDAKKNHPRDQ